MKNFKPSMSFVASVILAALVVAPVFAAGPTQAPPTNLVNAQFNSVTTSSATITATAKAIEATTSDDFSTTARFKNNGLNGYNIGVQGESLGTVGGLFYGGAYGIIASNWDWKPGTAAGYFTNKTTNPTNYVQLATPTKSIDAVGPANVNGHLAATSIGAFTTVTISSGPTGAATNAVMTPACPANYILLSCGFKNAGNNKSYLTNSYPQANNSCYITVYNNELINLSYTGYARCFNPAL